jgi:hypothetical protein
VNLALLRLLRLHLVDPENLANLVAPQAILAVPVILYLPKSLEMFLQSANQQASLIETSLKRS